MLAPPDDPLRTKDFFKRLQYPLLCSYKYDGIRAIVKSPWVLSRNLTPLPSVQVQDEFGDLDGLDGELIVGNPTFFNVYNLTMSHVKSMNKPNERLRFYVFDVAAEEFAHLPFYRRLEVVEGRVTEVDKSSVRFVRHLNVENEDELLEFEAFALSKGYEGIMMRSPLGCYKWGRGTFNEGLIYKLKRFTDDEGVLVGFKERMTNTNLQETDERGYAKRSKVKEGLVPAGTVGTFVVEYKNDIIDVAPGQFTHTELEHIFNNQAHYIGRYLKFRFFGHGIKDKPRFPRAVGFRAESDL